MNIHVESWKVSLGMLPIPEHLYEPRNPVQVDADARIFLSPEKKQEVIAEIEKRLSSKTPCVDIHSDLIKSGMVPAAYSAASFRILFGKANKAYRDKNNLRHKNDIIFELWDSGITDIDTLAAAVKSPRKLVFHELNKSGRRQPVKKWAKGRI